MLKIVKTQPNTEMLKNKHSWAVSMVINEVTEDYYSLVVDNELKNKFNFHFLTNSDHRTHYWTLLQIPAARPF